MNSSNWKQFRRLIMSSGFRVQADICLSEERTDGWNDKLLLSTVHCQLLGILWTSNSSYAMHHTVVNTYKDTKNLKLLHPHSNWILNPSITEGLNLHSTGPRKYQTAMSQNMYLFKSFGITKIHTQLYTLPDGYEFHLTFNYCTVYEYI